LYIIHEYSECNISTTEKKLHNGEKNGEKAPQRRKCSVSVPTHTRIGCLYWIETMEER